MGFILSFIARILFFIIAIPATIIATALSLISHNANMYYKEIAIGIDVFGNVLCAPIFNIVFITKKGCKFGKHGETISSVLGKNQRDETLMFCGKLIAKILDAIEFEHCKNSINETIC